jgi:hypothetical protein
MQGRQAVRLGARLGLRHTLVLQDKLGNLLISVR